MCIAGAGVSRGYLNNEALTKEKFIDNPFGEGLVYRTGDLARWLPDGNIEFLGRIDDQVSIRGFRIELGEIENQLVSLDQIDEAIVIAKKDDEEKYLCAYIVINSDKELKTSEIRSSLSAILPFYMIPSYFVQLGSIPMTRNGKVDKKALPAPEIDTECNYVAPRNELELKLQEIWSQALNINKDIIGIESNFFDIGGNSLKIISLIGEINKSLGIKLNISVFFLYPTLKQLSLYIELIRNNEDTSNKDDDREELII